MDHHDRLRTMACDRLDQPIAVVPQIEMISVESLERERRDEDEALLGSRGGDVDVAVRSIVEHPVDLSTRLPSTAGDGLQRVHLQRHG